jgi:hypothetical protein
MQMLVTYSRTTVGDGRATITSVTKIDAIRRECIREVTRKLVQLTFGAVTIANPGGSNYTVKKRLRIVSSSQRYCVGVAA